MRSAAEYSCGANGIASSAKLARSAMRATLPGRRCRPPGPPLPRTLPGGGTDGLGPFGVPCGSAPGQVRREVVEGENKPIQEVGELLALLGLELAEHPGQRLPALPGHRLVAAPA